jgi:hypothetical protein
VQERLSRVEKELGELRLRLDRLEKRLDHPAPSASPSPVEAPDGSPPPPLPIAASLPALESLPAFAGRSCLVLGGAYLLRFATERGTISAPVGAALGTLYAFGWLYAAARSATAKRVASALFHLATASLVLFPLLVEASSRLRAFPPAATIPILAAAVAAGVFLTIRRELAPALPTLFTLVLASTAVLMFLSRRPAPFALFLLLLGALSLLLAGVRGSTGLALTTALVVDASVLLLVALSTGENRPDWLATAPVGPIQIGLAAVYFGSFGLFLVGSDFTAGPVTWLQSAAAFLVGFEAALPRLGEHRTPAGLFALAVATASVVAAGIMERQGRAISSYAWAVVFGSAFAVEGLRLVFPGAPATACWALLALFAAAFADGFRRRALLPVSAALALLAAAGASVLPVGLRTFLGPAAAQGERPGGFFLLGALATVGCWALVARRPAGGFLDPLLRAIPLTLGLVAIGTLLVGGTAMLLGSPGPGALATLRSAVLLAAGLGLAGLHRATGRPELRWLLGALLVFQGAKLLFDELSLGQAGPIVAGLACYGVALLGIPRLARRPAPPLAGE